MKVERSARRLADFLYRKNEHVTGTAVTVHSRSPLQFHLVVYLTDISTKESIPGFFDGFPVDVEAMGKPMPAFG